MARPRRGAAVGSLMGGETVLVIIRGPRCSSRLYWLRMGKKMGFKSNIKNRKDTELLLQK
jgi:hypothetical protein